MTAHTTASDVLARALHAAGCRHAFGIPGGEVLSLMAALDRAGIEFVLTKHENSAGFMAEAVYYGTGAPGILVATLGPGVTNAVTAIANAWQERVPMLVLTGCVDPADALTYTHQVFDHQALLRPITKGSFTAIDGAIDALIAKALALALDGQPGPVHIDVPVGVAGADQPRSRPLQPATSIPAVPATGAQLDEARRLLGRSRRPVLIVGLDVTNQRAEDGVAGFATRFGVPVITTYKAKGVLPEDHPLSLGGAGLSPKADGLLLPFVRDADLVLLAGYDPIEMRIGWRDPFASDQPVIEFSAIATLHGMHQADLSFVGPIGPALQALSEGVSPGSTWIGGTIADLRERLARAFAPTADWGPAAIFETARRVLPRETIATADSGAHRILLSQMWTCYGARDLRQSTGLCTMGCAVPLAIGSKLAEPHRPVVAFVGDAGLEMSLGELATARRLGRQVIVIVLVDQSLGLIELKQRTSGLPNLGVDFDGTDFAAVAAALGGGGATVSSRDGLCQALAAALSHPGFSVIACVIGPRAYDGLF